LGKVDLALLVVESHRSGCLDFGFEVHMIDHIEILEANFGVGHPIVLAVDPTELCIGACCGSTGHLMCVRCNGQQLAAGAVRDKPKMIAWFDGVEEPLMLDNRRTGGPDAKAGREKEVLAVTDTEKEVLRYHGREEEGCREEGSWSDKYLETLDNPFNFSKVTIEQTWLPRLVAQVAKLNAKVASPPGRPRAAVPLLGTRR
jgi:hypothetical protein